MHRYFLSKEAQTSIYLAENDDYETGRYWHHRKQLTPNQISLDQDYSEELWNCGYDVWGEEPCAVTRRCLPEEIAPDSNMVNCFYS